jgi:hypothetical protein
VCGRVILLVCADELQELLCSSLLEQTHQRTAESLRGIRGDLCDVGLVAGASLDVTASNLLEFEVSGDIGRDENVGEFSVGHEEFGNEIDVPVVGAAVLLPWLAAVVVAVLLEELRRMNKSRVVEMRSEGSYSFDVDRGCLTAQWLAWCGQREVEGYAPAVVIVAVDVQDLLALYTQHTVALLVPLRT